MIDTSVKNDGFHGCFFDTKLEIRLAMIVLSGSDGMFSVAKKIAKRYMDNGIPSLAVAYYNTPQTPKNLAEIPVEFVENAVRWLRGRGYVKIAVYGISKGAEYALLSASLIENINAVVAVSPSCCVFQGLTANRRPAEKSSWSWRGNSQPYVSFGTYIPHFFSNLLTNREIRFFDEYNKLLDTELNEENTIKVENIKGSILLLSAHDDTMWPSERMGKLIEERLTQKGFPHFFRHQVYEYASHALCPISSPLYKGIRMERKYPKECAQSRENALNLSLDFLDSV